jgi:hypothetical protein
MADQNNESFKSITVKEKTVTIIGITFLIILVIGFVFGIYFFGFVDAWGRFFRFIQNRKNVLLI